MKVVQFAPDSPEAKAAARCVAEVVVIPGYGVVDMVEFSLIDGIETVTVHFLDSPTQPDTKSAQGRIGDLSVYDDVRARIKADEKRAALWPNDESLEHARADIVGEILKIAEHWRDKAQSYGPEETFVAFRSMVCEQILDALNEALWDE